MAILPSGDDDCRWIGWILYPDAAHQAQQTDLVGESVQGGTGEVRVKEQGKAEEGERQAKLTLGPQKLSPAT